ncbi:MAG TPA: protease pro-enzyme activation domain-containing protein [Candidatus Saccharimonadales bacterium]|nr:protease pro-enzyme activation domain-containing protein [Candidatus Saccharimonadales bacterium]
MKKNQKRANLPSLMGVWCSLAACLGGMSSFGADAGMKTLPGHIPAAIAKLSATGNLPSTNRLNLAIGLPLRDAKGLDAFLAGAYDPASPNYRRYLTPDQFTEKFGPTAEDYAAVAAFAQRNHLTVRARHANRLVLDVNGAVADIQRAFHLTLHTYRHPTEARDFYAPDSEPSVDASLPVADITGLNNYQRPQPKSLRSLPAISSRAVARSGSGLGGTYFGNDFRAAYLPNVTLTGAGQMVGLLEFDGFYPVDVTAYESAAGITPVPLQTILLDGFDGTPTTGPNSGDEEVSLDIEMALAFAPGLSKIVSFEAGPNGFQNDILSAMTTNTQISQFSCSWGWSGGPSTTTDTLFKQLAAQGQSFFSASGDSDAFTVGSSSANGVDNPLLDNEPSSNPYITMVGGTTLSTTGPDGAWASETAWNWGLNKGAYNGTSGGVSSYYPIPSWQASVSMAANGGSTVFRNTPDVASVADNIYVYSDNGGNVTLAGTSCAAPLWAGLAALMNQQAASSGKPPVGFVNPAIYALAESASYSASLHDITTGNNVSSDSPNNYYAVAGYDLCTGWGTPAGQPLIDALAGAANPLWTTPFGGFAASGPVGGPFTPSSESFLLTNQSANALTWSVAASASWLTAAPSGGVLGAGVATNVTASLNSAATNLVAGLYTNTVLFSNWNSGLAQTVLFTLQVGQPPPSLVQNGGFETGNFSGWTLVGDTIRRGTIYDAVESASGVPSVVHSGTYGAFLGDNKLATLSQTLSTVPGQAYVLSLWLDNPSAGAGQEFIVKWNTADASSNTLYNLVNPPAFGWTNLQFTVVASSSSMVLQFAAENVPNCFGLDDVSLTALTLPTPQFGSAAETTNGLTLTWPTVAGLVYQVQYTTDLTTTNWLNLGAAMTANTNSLTVTDTNINDPTSQRFYRLLEYP